MKFVASGFVAALTIILLTPTQAETRFELAEQHLAKIIRSQYYAVILGRLEDLSMTRSALESKTIDLINGYADCMVSALKGVETLQASEMLDVLAEGYTPQKITGYFSYLTDTEAKKLTDNIEKPIRTCARRIEVENGLVKDADGNFVVFP